MTIEFQLPPEVASELNRRAELAGQDVSTYVADAVRQIVGADQDALQVPYEQWQHDFRAWVESQPSRNADFDDSRESMYD